MIFGEFSMLFAVLVMLAVMLFASSLLKKYQAHKALLRTKVRRIEKGISYIENALNALQKIPIPEGLNTTLRQDLFDRYQDLQVVFPSFPDINKKLREAKLKLQTESPADIEEVPFLETEDSLGEITRAIDEVVYYLDSIRPLKQALSSDVIANYKSALGERRAEVISRYLLTLSSRAEQQGNREEAKGYLNRLLSILRTRGPNSDFVRQLYGEAEQQLHALNHEPSAS